MPKSQQQPATRSKLEQESLVKPDRGELLLQAIDSIRDYAIFLLDPSGCILTWNQGAQNLKGYTESEILGQHFSIFYPEEAKATGFPDYELKEAKKYGRFEDEGWRIRKDGTRFWASVVITKVIDVEGNLAGFSKVTRDLTDRKAAEQRLRDTEERFRLLVDGVREYAIFMLDPDGNVTSWNEGARRIKGYESKEILGKHFSIFYPEKDIREGKPGYELEEAKLTGRFEEEGWRVRKDGSMLWANVVITAIRDRNRKLIGFSKVTRDLTEKKRAEDKLQRAYQNLERMVESRTQELGTANAALKQREKELESSIRMRDDFLSVASHELKTPITSLKMQLQMLKMRTQPERGLCPPPEKMAGALEVSLRQVDRLTALVEDLLDVARAQENKLGFRFEHGDLIVVAREVITRLQDLASASRVTLQLEGAESVPGRFDRFRMDQVLVNLLTNAIKYASGSIVRIQIEDLGDSARIAVRDQGPGIPLELQAKIFERFERATSSRNISGLGLGLYITKRIVEGHHGTIRVQSQLGQGAAFIVEIPLDQPEPPLEGPVGAL